MREFMLRSLSVVVLCLAAFAIEAHASALSRYNEAVARAYDHYRSGLFYVQTGNPAVAGFEIAKAVAVWKEAVIPFAAAPPDAFSDDEAFGRDLQDIFRRLHEADALLAAGDGDGAEAQLTPVRTLLADLRHRNGVIVFSDRVDAANAAMDRLWVYRHAPPDWSDDGAVSALLADAAVTLYHYRRLESDAPAALAANPEFQRIVTGAVASLEALWVEILAGNEEMVISYLRELRSFDRILWLQFG
jgi:hypothetical protein